MLVAFIRVTSAHGPLASANSMQASLQFSYNQNQMYADIRQGHGEIFQSFVNNIYSRLSNARQLNGPARLCFCL